MEEYNDEGNDELAELSRSIENMRLQILSNENIKQEMLQNISHDIKTPIGIIKSYAEAMQDKHFIENGPDIIIKQSDILYNKTQQLITYNKLSYLTKDKEFEDVNMKRLIESVVNNLKMTRQEINFELDLDRVYFKGYSDNYSTVIENIIDNALRYAKSLISIKLRENLIEIYNDGEAIDEKFIQQGFKPYEKGSKGKFGLGMSIAVKTLDFFNYKLSVRNENIGVRFIISSKDL
jgi:two-component system sensor histidine kinase CssS